MTLSLLSPGHQKKLMLAVKKLCDLQRALLQAESGPGTLRRKAPRPLHLVSIEPPDPGGEGSSPRPPQMQTFQGRDLGAVSSHARGSEQGPAVKNAGAMSRSQDGIDPRSRGSGRSQDPASCSPHRWSQESLDSGGAKERDLPEGYDQRPLQQLQLKQVPLGTATVFKYPPIPAKPRLAGSSAVPPHGSPALKGLGSLRSQNLTRYALSDGEPEEDEEEASVPPGHLSSYATLTRKPGRSQLARLPASPEKNVGRSQSFAVRSRKKGPPPPPPKRLSSVSSGTSDDSSPEARTEDPADPGQGPPTLSTPGQGSREGSGLRRRVQSESISTQTSNGSDPAQGVKSDSEEEESRAPGLQGSSSPHNSSSECIPFAEEGNLTIKQRPKAPGPPRAEAVLEPPDKNQEVPEFNLKESDTVKRRHRPKDKDQDGDPPHEETGSWAFPHGPEVVRLRKTDPGLESPATGSPTRPPVSSKPPAIAPKPVRHSLLAAQGKTASPGSRPGTLDFLTWTGTCCL